MEPVYNVEEAAKILQISPNTLLNWLREGRIRGVKVGRYWRIREQDIEEFMEANKSSLEKDHDQDK